MPGFFDALENFKPMDRKKPTVEIQGKVMEVTPEMFKKVMDHGAENFELENDKIVLKQTIVPGKTHEMLVKSDEGYVFIDGDPCWPDTIKEGGYTWQIEQE